MNDDRRKRVGDPFVIANTRELHFFYSQIGEPPRARLPRAAQVDVNGTVTKYRRLDSGLNGQPHLMPNDNVLRQSNDHGRTLSTISDRKETR